MFLIVKQFENHVSSVLPIQCAPLYLSVTENTHEIYLLQNE